MQVLIFLLHHSEKKYKLIYLTDEFNITKATLSDTIKTLEQKKLIHKEYLPHDTRSYSIHLTKKGKDIANRTSMFAKQIQVPIDKLHTDDKENLLLSLLEIIHQLHKSGIITIQRMCYTCHYYKTNDKGQKHFCKLLNKTLANNELRIDCAEHIQSS